MPGASIESTLELWASSLRDVKARIRPLFTQERVASSAGAFLDGLLWTRGLLIRRNIADGDLAFFSTWCPTGTGIATLVTVEGHRWAIEDSFETAKNELGLDHNETRSWHGWHRHVSLVMLAFAMMAAIRHRANAVPPPKTISRVTKPKTAAVRRH